MTDISVISGLPSPYISLHIFNRQAGYVLDYHSHKKLWHVNYITEGQILLSVGGKTVNVHKNHFFILPPDIPHKIVSDGGYEQIGVNIESCDDEKNIYRLMNACFNEFPVIVNTPAPEKSFNDCKKLLSNPVPLNIATYINMFEKVILNAVCTVTDRKNTFYSKISRIITENDPCFLTLADICRMTNYSKTHLERLALKELGCGITTYLNNIRLNKICSLLQYTDMPMSQIAENTGLYDASHLITFFKHKMNVTPGRYRKEYFSHKQENDF